MIERELDTDRLTELQKALGSRRAELAAILLDELDRATALVEAAFAEGDLETAALAAHEGRNSALMLDARPVLDALRAIESGARQGEASLAAAGLEQLRQEWPALRRRLEIEAQRPD